MQISQVLDGAARNGKIVFQLLSDEELTECRTAMASLMYSARVAMESNASLNNDTIEKFHLFLLFVDAALQSFPRLFGPNEAWKLLVSENEADMQKVWDGNTRDALKFQNQPDLDVWCLCHLISIASSPITPELDSLVEKFIVDLMAGYLQFDRSIETNPLFVQDWIELLHSLIRTIEGDFPTKLTIFPSIRSSIPRGNHDNFIEGTFRLNFKKKSNAIHLLNKVIRLLSQHLLPWITQFSSQLSQMLINVLIEALERFDPLDDVNGPVTYGNFLSLVATVVELQPFHPLRSDLLMLLLQRCNDLMERPSAMSLASVCLSQVFQSLTRTVPSLEPVDIFMMEREVGDMMLLTCENDRVMVGLTCLVAQLAEFGFPIDNASFLTRSMACLKSSELHQLFLPSLIKLCANNVVNFEVSSVVKRKRDEDEMDIDENVRRDWVPLHTPTFIAAPRLVPTASNTPTSAAWLQAAEKFQPWTLEFVNFYQGSCGLMGTSLSPLISAELSRWTRELIVKVYQNHTVAFEDWCRVLQAAPYTTSLAVVSTLFASAAFVMEWPNNPLIEQELSQILSQPRNGHVPNLKPHRLTAVKVLSRLTPLDSLARFRLTLLNSLWRSGGEVADLISNDIARLVTPQNVQAWITPLTQGPVACALVGMGVDCESCQGSKKPNFLTQGMLDCLEPLQTCHDAETVSRVLLHSPQISLDWANALTRHLLERSLLVKKAVLMVCDQHPSYVNVLVETLSKSPNLVHVMELCTYVASYCRQESVLGTLIMFVLYNWNSSKAGRTLGYDFMKSVARARFITCRVLLRPFMDKIAIFLSEQLFSNVYSDVVIKILGWEGGLFLKKYLHVILPHLVMNRKLSNLKEVAKGLYGDYPHPMVHLLSSNLPVILTEIFLLGVGTPQYQAAITYLTEDCAEREVSLRQLMTEPVLHKVVARLCMSWYDDEKAPAILSALEHIWSEVCEGVDGPADYGTQRDTLQSPRKDSSKDAIPKLLFKTSFPIMVEVNSRLHDVLDPEDPHSMTVKLQTVASLTQVILHMKNRVKVILPQLATLFQSVLLDMPHLRDAILDAWKALVSSLGPSKLQNMADQVVVVLTYPKDYTPLQVNKVVEVLMILLDKVKENYPWYIPLRQPFDKDSLHHAIRNTCPAASKQTSPQEIFEKLLLRVAHENSLVVDEALDTMNNLLRRHQEWIHQQVMSHVENATPLIGSMISTLIQVTRRFQQSNDQARQLQGKALNCLGVLGAVDPSRLNLDSKDDAILVDNFADHEVNVKFVARLIQHHLTPGFRSATGNNQTAFATAIQELLKYCGFTSSIIYLDEDKSPRATRLKEQWDVFFTQKVQEAIQPLLDTTYSSLAIPLVAVSYPIFAKSSSYFEWISRWVADLLYRVKGDPAHSILQCLPNVIRTEDGVNVATYILPYVVLHILCPLKATPNDDEKGWNDDIYTEIMSVLSSTQSSKSSDFLRMAVHTVFSVLDYLVLWTQSKSKHAQHKKYSKAIMGRDSSLVAVETLLHRIPHDVLARAAFFIGNDARALFHLEASWRENKKVYSDGLYSQMFQAYAGLRDVDGMYGVSRVVGTLSVEQQVLQAKVAGQWTQAQSCHEFILQKKDSLENHVGVAACLRELGHNAAMLSYTTGIISQHPEWAPTLNAFAAEASMRLGKWDTLEQFEKGPTIPTFESELGNVLLAMRQKDLRQVETLLSKLREGIIPSFLTTSKDTYSGAYDKVVKLHMLHEVDTAARLWCNDSTQAYVKSMGMQMTVWDDRLDLTLESHQVREPILSLRRSLLSMGDKIAAKSVLTKLWLESAKLARRNGYLDTAYSNVLQATSLEQSMDTIFQMAKYHAATGDLELAIDHLSQALAPYHVEKRPSQISDPTEEDYARNKARLTLGRLAESGMRMSGPRLVSLFNEASTLIPSEKNLFYLGRLFMKLYQAEVNRKPETLVQSRSDRSLATWQSNIVQFASSAIQKYIKALQYGYRYIYQTLPRILGLWMELGETYGLIRSNDDADNRFTALNTHVLKNFRALPPSLLLTSFYMLVSRMLHPNKMVREVVESLIRSVLETHPHHALWQLMYSKFCQDTNRQAEAEKLFANARTMTDPHLKTSVVKVIQDMTQLCKEIRTFNDVSFKNAQSSKLSRHSKLMNKKNWMVMLPTSAVLTVNLPDIGIDTAGAVTEAAFIDSFMDDFQVMSSQARPRKVTISGSDGKHYTFLFKPKDDLRADNRVILFNHMMNKIFKRDVEARRAELHFRTYAVIPLTEGSGILEWIDGLIPLRNAVKQQWELIGIPNPIPPTTVHSFDLIETWMKELGEKAKTKCLAEFEEVCKKFPPVLHNYFTSSFPDPMDWYKARNMFVKSNAAFSIVGHVLGVGDRHGENILIDESSGAVVHVDFNCIFEKGLVLRRPELVPFRLTRCMVDTFGPTGVDGPYKKTCELTLKILRTHEETLKTVMATFVHDPLFEWLNSREGAAKGKIILQTIESKIRGTGSHGLPMSVEGQVADLIAVATDKWRLAQMYIGWMSYM